MCRALLPRPDDFIGPAQHRMAVWSMTTILDIEIRDDAQAWIRGTLQERLEVLAHQLPACQCGLITQVGQVMVRHLAYEVALVASEGDQVAAIQSVAARNLSLADPVRVGRMLYDLAHGRQAA